MRNIEETEGESLAVGELPEGCKRCIEGRKVVLFVTGMCKQSCYYCTISKSRWQKDEVWANERLVKSDDDLLNEVRKSGATGAGMTGGEPLLKLERVAHFIRLLKKTFGNDFHIHLYTCGDGFGFDELKTLHEAGLDELRIHLNKELIKEAAKFDWEFGMEVPVLPGGAEQLKELVDFLDEQDAKFLNLNELEFSERNIEPMESRGMETKDSSLTAIKGSEETAKEVLEHARDKKLHVHFCTAALKLNYQLRNRLKNRARNIRKPFEKVTDDGFLLKGIVFDGDLEEIKEALLKMKVPERMMFVNKDRQRVEISVEAAKNVARKIRFKVALVEEYPTAEPWDFELTPLNFRTS